MNIRKKVQQLIRRHGTDDPERLARAMGINVIYTDLGGAVYGTYIKYKRTKTILIDADRTPEQLRPFVLAHELGHALCTPDANTSWLSAYTMPLNADRVERQANEFAVRLLLNDEYVAEHGEYGLYRLARPEFHHELWHASSSTMNSGHKK